jgi:(p)ppGpp synthase/HD superfamily hydrolase
MNGARPKITGSGSITHRCAQCQQPIKGDPIFLHRDGRLVAVHADCHQKEQ